MNYQPIYQPYNFPAFGPQTRPAAFPQGGGYPSATLPAQSASVPVSAPQAGGFLIQPVTSREEALAVIADPLAAGVLMPDLGHGVIYLKRFNTQTGASDFAEFVMAAPKAEPARTAEELVTVSVFNSTVERLREEIERLKKPAGKKAVKQDEPADE